MWGSVASANLPGLHQVPETDVAPAAGEDDGQGPSTANHAACLARIRPSSSMRSPHFMYLAINAMKIPSTHAPMHNAIS